MKQLLHNLRSSIRDSFYKQKWRYYLLNENTSNFLVQDDPEIARIEIFLASFQNTSKTYKFTLDQLINMFSITLPCENPTRYIRAYLQVLVTYSICTSDVACISRKEISTLETSIAQLEQLGADVSVSVSLMNSPSELSSLKLASLLEKEAKENMLRAAIIKILFNLTAAIPKDIIYQAYNPRNDYHICNATKILYQISPRSNPLTGIAFALVMNPPSASISQTASVNSFCSNEAKKDFYFEDDPEKDFNIGDDLST